MHYQALPVIIHLINITLAFWHWTFHLGQNGTLIWVLSQEDYIKEMSIGLKPGESESESETEMNETDECKSGITVRKTRVQRNREKAEKLKVS